MSIATLQLHALNRLLRHCKNSPFYSSRLSGGQLTSLEELKQLPLTTKEDIRQNSPYGFLCVPTEELFQYHESFGTTGIPASTWLTREDFLDLADSVNRGGINFSKKDIVLIRFPYAISGVAHFMQKAAQIRGACVIPASSRTPVSPYPRILDLLGKLKVTVLASLPMQALLIAETAELLGMDPRKDFPHLRCIYAAGELLTSQRRKTLEEAWGVPVCDNYGMTEIGAAGVECEHKALHPLEDKFIYELLDDDMKEDVPMGEIGNLVVTTLTRKGTPLIRYITGDRARMLQKNCECGKKKIIEIRGRKQEVITIKDRSLDLWDLGDIVSCLPCGRFWAAGQYGDTVKLIVEEEKQGDVVDQATVNSLESRYGIGLQIEIVPKGTLCDRSELISPGSAGKPRYIYTQQELEQKAYLASSKQ